MNGSTLPACIIAMIMLLACHGEAESVEAWIDSDCHPQPGIIVVPEGNTAKNFDFNNLEAGTSCEPGGITSPDKGWCIQKEDGTNIYCYKETDGVSSQLPIPLSTLTLGPGRYTVTVGGGRNAHVIVTYNISGPKLTPGEPNTLKSEIDEGCNPQPAILIVPEGNIASNFQLGGLSAGSDCNSGKTILDEHWTIAREDGSLVYEYNRNYDENPTEPYGALGSISLGPGRYSINVAGGRGAYVIVSYSLTGPTLPPGQPGTVNAEIDNDCTPQGGTLIVPQGATATKFKLEGLSAGSNCHTLETIRDLHWVIIRDDDVIVYEYNKNYDEPAREPYGALNTISLGPGRYYVRVSGGKGAYVVVGYELVKPEGVGEPKGARCDIKNVGGTPMPTGCEFSVPVGSTAMNFQLGGLSRGYSLSLQDFEAWKIKDDSAKDVYTYFRRDGEAAKESLGKLSDLSLPPGNYSLTIAGGEGAYVSIGYELVGSAAPAAKVNQTPVLLSFTPTPPSPQPPGTTITWTATATDPDGDPIYYRFLLRGPSTGDQWKEMKGWSREDTWSWNTAAEDTGDNQVEVWIRDDKHNGSVSYDGKALGGYTVSEVSDVSGISSVIGNYTATWHREEAEFRDISILNITVKSNREAVGHSTYNYYGSTGATSSLHGTLIGQYDEKTNELVLEGYLEREPPEQCNRIHNRVEAKWVNGRFVGIILVRIDLLGCRNESSLDTFNMEAIKV